jgi:hypothetical protein
MLFGTAALMAAAIFVCGGLWPNVLLMMVLLIVERLTGSPVTVTSPYAGLCCTALGLMGIALTFGVVSLIMRPLERAIRRAFEMDEE